MVKEKINKPHELSREEIFKLFIAGKINHENFKQFGISKAKYYKVKERYDFWSAFIDPLTELVLRLSNNQFIGITKPDIKIVKKAWKGFSPPKEKTRNDVDG